MKELFSWWSHIPEHISPIAFNIGPVEVHYYGLMYSAAFATVYLLVLSRIKNERIKFSKEVIDNYFLWLITALLIGGRVGYVLFYNLSYYLKHPLEIIFPFDINNGFRYIGLCGMSYHGALVGIIAASVIYCRKFKLNFWALTDLLVSAVPFCYTLEPA